MSDNKSPKQRWLLLLSVVLLGCTLFGLQRLPSAERETETSITGSAGNESEGAGRDAWFYTQRAYPQETIPAAAQQQALEQLAAAEARQRELNLRTADIEQLAWQPLGPNPIGTQIGQFAINYGERRVACAGRVAAIALHPQFDGTNNRTVYLGAAQGGVWRSDDGGETWRPLTDGLPSLVIGSLAIDPTNPNVIWAGTGDNGEFGSYYGAGLLKSTDGGANWQVITGPNSTLAPVQPAFINAGILKVEIDPTNTNTVYVTTGPGHSSSAASKTGAEAPLGQRGLWKTTDGGQTWTNLNVTNDGGRISAMDVITDPLNRQRVIASMYGVGLFRSENGGQAWTQLAGGLPASGFGRIALTVGPPLQGSQNSTIYAAVAATGDTLLGIFGSTDNGATWTRVTLPQAPGQANYNLAIAVDPTDARVVYYATAANADNDGGTVWRTTNAGQSWQDLSKGDPAGGGLHADSHAFAIARNNPNVVFTGNDGGIWRTNNAKANTVAWASLNNTLNITQFQMIALHPTSLDFIVGGTQDNGTNRYSGNASWANLAEGDGGFAYIDQSNPKIVWHTYQNDNTETGFGPRVTLDGTVNNINWTDRACRKCQTQPGGFNARDRVSFYAPLAGNAGFTGANGNVVYFGTQRLYRTANLGATWTGLGPSSDGFGSDLSKGQGYLTAIAAHPRLNPAQGSDPQGEVVWAGTSDGNIQVTTDAGKLGSATWRNVTKAPLPNRFITDIGLDPNEQRRAVVTYSGFNANTPTTPGKVFLTNDQGGTWTDISGDLPDTPANSVAVDPNQANTYYLGTDIGAFQTTNGGQNWVRLGGNLPHLAVYAVRYHAATKNLVIGTHGRGVWKLALTPSTVKAVATVSAASFSATAFGSESIAAAFGESLGTGVEVATTVPLPTKLAGSSIKVKDSAGTERDAPLFFVAPQQINYLIPAGTANGAATVTVTSGDGTISQGTINIATTAPGWFTANANGQGVPAGVVFRAKADGTQSLELLAQTEGGRQVPREIDLGPEGDQVILVLFGTGFRGAVANAVTCRIGGEASEVLFAGPQGGLVGLDQANLRVPRTLIGRGVVDLAFTADGRVANTVQIRVK
ncbi:MAG: hypothetical protein HYR56_15635 [Acidobacteria bacterium]|nr:hypothetical protein [Acidobacteriota bacterium]MBI3422019.1 hypothetical protein [Acidobacteriota bacterium]